MAAFKAFVPLVRALRNPGMCARHWDRLSEELNIDLHPDDTFNLAKAEELDLLNEERLKTLMKISDIAGAPSITYKCFTSLHSDGMTPYMRQSIHSDK